MSRRTPARLILGLGLGKKLELQQVLTLFVRHLDLVTTYITVLSLA
jgi:hypothetical protein